MAKEALKAKAAPDRTAVLVIDMQKDYCCEGGTFHRRGFDITPAQRLAGRLDAFLKEARKVLKEILFVKIVKVEGVSSSAAADLYARLGVERNYDPSWAEFYGVTPGKGDRVVPKYSYSAFHATYLDRLLRAAGVRTLVLTGIATNVCIESTARDGFSLDYHIIVPEDLTEGTSAEAKKWSLANVDTFFGEVVRSEDLLECWGIGKGPP